MGIVSQLDYDIIIIGGGPAGLTAGIYASRSHRRTLLIEKLMPGGLIAMTDHIENYPGFPDGINGYELGNLFQQQAKKFGTKITSEEVISIQVDDKIKKVITSSSEYTCAAIIIASGVSYRKLNIPGENNFSGKGVSYCGVCDAAFYKDKEVAVIGGGDTAIEEAIHLTKFAKKVSVIHRREQLRSARIIQERAFSNPKIEFVWNSIPIEIIGTNKVSGLKIKNVKTYEESQISLEGVFIFVGYTPNTDYLKGIIALNNEGYIITNEKMETSVEGIFAAGDARDKVLRQVATCIGEGAIAGFFANKYIEESLEDIT